MPKTGKRDYEKVPREQALTGTRKKDLRFLWPEEDMKLFKEELGEILTEQTQKSKPAVPRPMLKQCNEALKWLVYNHEYMRHMIDQEYANRVEIAELKKLIVESGKKVQVDEDKRIGLEKNVEELEAELKATQQENAQRKETLVKKDENLVQAGVDAKEFKGKCDVIMKEEAEKKEEEKVAIQEQINELKVVNTKMAKACAKANSSSNQLKEALAACSTNLKDIVPDE